MAPLWEVLWRGGIPWKTIRNPSALSVSTMPYTPYDGPFAVARSGASANYAGGAISSPSPLAALGFIVFIVAILAGVLLGIRGSILQGVAFAAGGVMCSLALFGTASRREQRFKLAPGSGEGRHRTSIALMLIGLLVLLASTFIL